MPVISIYYANPILKEENIMLLPIDSIAKIEKLTEELCVLTLTTQSEKLLVLETLSEIEEKIYWASQPDAKPESLTHNPWSRKERY